MLSKSDLAAFRQCPRRLWLETHAPHEADPGNKGSWRRVQDGTLVGNMARNALGAKVVWPQSQETPELAAAAAIALLSNAPGRPGVEIPLLRDGLSARADALIPGRKGYVLQETKSCTFPLKKDGSPGKVDDHLLDDLAIQIWVMTGGALPMERAELNFLNGKWRYPGGGDYSGLFRQYTVGPEIQERIADVPQWLAAAKQVVNGVMPTTATGSHCNQPYACTFHRYCNSIDPKGAEHPIELLPGAGKRLAKQLRETRGYTSLLEPQFDEFTGKGAPLFRRMQQAHRASIAVLETSSGDTLAALAYPKYYLDFEGINLAVPIWEGVRPYEQIPFQWSCHIENSPHAFEHREFLDLSGSDPSLACMRALLEAIRADGVGPIFVYHQTYEEGRLSEFAQRHPKFAPEMNSLIRRLVDLRPLVESSYYHPGMRGSFSMKKLLPTIAPELAYSELGGVTDGTAAQVAYFAAALDPETTEEEKNQSREDLLRYCKQDTWAMVEVAYHLQRLGRPSRDGRLPSN